MTRIAHFSKEDAKEIAVHLINGMIVFLDTTSTVSDKKKEFSKSINDLISLREKIDNEHYLNAREVDNTILAEFTRNVIHCFPVLSDQLQKFFDANKAAISRPNLEKYVYRPHSRIAENFETMEKIKKRRLKVIQKYRKDPTDEVTIYAMLYMHILLTEVVETIHYKEFKELLSHFELGNRFDADHIFSVGGKVDRIGKAPTTMAKAIRNSLAHNNFDIIDDGKQKIIRFDNQADGYDFQIEFTVEEFLMYTFLSETLYIATQVLLNRIVLLIIIQAHFKS